MSLGEAVIAIGIAFPLLLGTILLVWEWIDRWLLRRRNGNPRPSDPPGLKRMEW